MEFLITGISSALIMLAVSWLNRKDFFDRPELTFTDEGEFVRIRSSSYARYYRTKGKLVKKSSVVKIQKAGCLSLFTRTRNVFDISAHPNHKDAVFEVAKQLFSNAEVVVIDIGS